MSETDTQQQLWGAETTKAIANFPVSGEPIPVPVARWLGRIKGAAARANAELGAPRRGQGGARSAPPATGSSRGELDDQFPIDVFQTGSGTSSNMNANEVIATLARRGAVHPNDHVNMGQSSNDVFPSAMHLAALDEIDERPPARARAALHAALEAQGERVRRRRQVGTHPPAWTRSPIRSARSSPATRAQVRQGIARDRRTRCRASARCRSAARPSAPASTRIRSSPRACATILAERHRPRRSRRRPTHFEAQARAGRRSSSAPAR